MTNKDKDNLEVNVHENIGTSGIVCSVKVVKKYTNKLLKFLVKYEESRIDKALYEGHYLEAIGSLHIQISEQLRFLLIKKVKGHENIPLNYEDKRFKTVLGWVKNLKDAALYKIAYVFGRINEEELSKLNELNTLRNKFSHSFKAREQYSGRKIKSIINEAKLIEKRLSQEVSRYGDIDILREKGHSHRGSG